VPDFRQKHQQAIELLNRGRTSAGRAILEEIHRIDPTDAQAAFSLGKLESEERRFDRSLTLLEPLVANPSFQKPAATLIIHVLSQAGRYAEAIRRASEFRTTFPLDPGLAMMAAAAHSSTLDYEGAERLLRQQLAATPSADIEAAHSSALLNLGRSLEAIAGLKDALARFPGDVGCLAALASATNYVSTSREEGFRIHGALARLVEFAVPVIDPLSYDNPPDPDRPLRIAMLSFDFRAHSVAYFVEAILRHHDRDRYHITAFSTSATEDDVTDRLRPLADAWKRNITGSPRLLAREVWLEKPDVVIDLGGLTGNSALPALVPQVAPVQVTAIGYPNTTGFSTVHYRIVDSLTDPPGDSDKFSTEKLVRLDPCFLCFTPRVNRAPALTGAIDSVVFGSFNKINKYSADCLQVWSEILRRVPESRLLLKSPALSAPAARDFLLRRFAEIGAPLDRIELLGRQENESDHLAKYDHIDIALDAFPYNGTTTTCEALMMGVPVIALEGSTHAGRVGVSLLTAAGFPESVARSREEYIAKAEECARNVQTFRSERNERSKKMLASALCDGPAYTARWQEAIRSMWRTWCERKRSRSSPSVRR
jgi:tetratricopeptide (TPR) repeat protein